ncbi:hypothetical protein BH11PSE12_BH11PSE12_14090 [soil metagenome]
MFRSPPISPASPTILTFNKRGTIALLVLCFASILMSGCATTKQVVSQHEEFGSTDVFSHSFSASDAASCEAARRALLSQGYVISESKSAFLKGRRKFQRDSEIHVEIEFNVVCAADGKGSNSTTVFANAVRDRYSLKKSSNSASIGVGALGSVSLPFGATDDSLVKVASETIPTGQFYDRFFQLMERYLDDSAVIVDEEAEKKKDLE